MNRRRLEVKTKANVIATSMSLSDNCFIAISTDTVVLLDKNKNFVDYLIEGEDPDGTILGGPIEGLTALVHRCYSTRERGISMAFRVEDKVFTFK